MRGVTTAPGVLYRCRVMHCRPGAPRYRFVYRSFYLLVDIDRLDEACAASSLISRNRFNLLSFFDKDHGPHNGGSLRRWLAGVLDEYGVDLAGGRVRLLTMPRVLGYGFHPISVFYCEHADGTLRAVVVEVHNTFGEHHFYVLHEQGGPMAWGDERRKDKRFHVSPFFDRDGGYRFHVAEPGRRLGLGIRLYAGADQTLRITTTLSGNRRALTCREILRSALAMPLMTFKVTFAIHWQALKLWLRGASYQSKPEPDRDNVS